MVNIISGIVLAFTPFALLPLFKNKKAGFVYIIFFLILLQTVLGFSTQILGIFYYNVIFTVVGIADIIVLLWVLKFKHKYRFDFSDVDWVLVALLAISFLTLYQVHNNYTGKINIATDQFPSYHEAQNMAYEYPYFSDEWYAVLLIKNSINFHFLPIIGFAGERILNLEIFFHSLVAELMLILGFNPLTKYSLLSIFANVLIISLSYLFLRLNKVSKLSAGLSSLLILYISSGANLPGIWNFIPVHAGIILCLIGLCFISMKDYKMASLACLPILLFYAPLLIFYGTGLIVFLLIEFRKQIRKHTRAIIYIFTAVLFATSLLFFILMLSPVAGVVAYIYSKIFYTSFYGPDLNVNLTFYQVLPLFAVFLAILGLRYIYKNLKWFLAVLILGFIVWFFYSFSAFRVFIEYERAVFFISILTCIAAGFGLWCIESRACKFNKKAFKCAQIFAVILFLLIIPFYTSGERWRNFIVEGIRGRSAVFYPKAPANNYLTEDDLRVFSGIEGKAFLSIPWKGTVVGVATQNYPVVTKQGTISVGRESTADLFLLSDCTAKLSMAKRLELDYVYIYSFNCPGFKKVAESREGLVLYKVIK